MKAPGVPAPLVDAGRTGAEPQAVRGRPEADNDPRGGANHLLQDRLRALARNLWWTWHPEVVSFFRDLDPIRWRQLDHNPIALLSEFTLERLEQRASELVLYSQINYAYRRLQEYLASDLTWAATHAGVDRKSTRLNSSH